MTVTYYLEVISSWCYWAEPAWAELRQRFAGRVHFRWKIALIDQTGLPPSLEQCEWFYRRSGTIVRSPFMLNAGWFDPELHEYLAPNLVAEAAKDFGFLDDRVRLAIAHAALREGRKVGGMTEAVAAAVAADETRLEPLTLRAAAESEAVRDRVRAATAEFHGLQVTQRPAFLLENGIGDRAIFSGVVSAAPVAATIEAMLQDELAYASFAAHFGSPPEPNGQPAQNPAP